MAKNYSCSGESYSFTAPSGGVVSGTPVLIGALLVIPEATAAVGVLFTGAIEGIFTGITALGTDTPAQGAKAYWDNTNFRLTTTSAGNTFCGWFMEAKASGVTTAVLKLAGAV